MNDPIPDAFVIAEVLTSTDYRWAAALLEERAIEMFAEAERDARRGYHSLAAEMRADARIVEERAKRFRRVAAQVREQEIKANG